MLCFEPFTRPMTNRDYIIVLIPPKSEDFSIQSTTASIIG